MKNIFFFFIVTITMNASAQTPDWLWAKNAGGTGGDVANSISTDALGNIYMAGYFKSATITFGSITLTNVYSYNRDIFLIKYAPNGNVLWAKGIGGTLEDFAESVTTDAWGNVYIAGYFASSSITFGSTTLTNAANTNSNTNTDIFLAKYDTSGNVIWAKRAGGTSQDVIKSLTTDALGNIYMTGWFYSSITFGTDTLTSANGPDIFLTKYDTNGNVLWAKRAGGTLYDYAMSVSTDALGNVYVVGLFSSSTITFGSTVLINAGGYGDIFLAKYDTNGNVLWAKRAGGIENDRAKYVTTDSSGNVYVVGMFSSSTITFGSTTLTSAGGFDGFFTKYASNGNVLWAKRIGGTDWDEANSVTTDATGNIYVVGNFGGSTITFDSITLTNAVGSYIFLTKYASNGNVIWAKSAGGKREDEANTVTTDISGNVYVAGYSNSSSITFGITTLTNSGLSSIVDIFLAKLGFPPCKPTTSKDTTVCKGNPVQLTADGGMYYKWMQDSDTTSIGKTASITVQPDITTTYTVVVSDTVCSVRDSVILTVNPLPQINAGNDTIINKDESVMLSVSGASTYLWEPATGLNDATIANPLAKPTQTILYFVTGTDNNQCSNTDSVQIIIKDKGQGCKGFFIPNAFSPNGNGFNDSLYVRGCVKEVKEISFVIYDRWGKKVFENYDLTKGWDGTYNGKELNTAVFVYYLKVTLATNEVIEQKGNVSLIR